MALLEDLRRHDPDAFHRFLWSKHLAYAASYEVSKRFGSSKIKPTRHLLIREALAYLRAQGADPHKDIRSVFEIGCSMGYLLRHLEVEVFPSATALHGLDIDRYAVSAGSAHLRSLRSRVELFVADLDDAEQVLGSRPYDVVLCCGVLMYVNRNTAERAVRTMFSNADRLVGLVCLAHPDGRHGGFETSIPRESDGALIHDIDSMIRQCNGNVVSRQWVGSGISGSAPSYVILAEPGSRRK